MNSHNHSRVLLAICVAGLGYLSLYPFDFSQAAPESGLRWHGPAIDSDWVDMLANVLAYLPLGLLARLTWRRHYAEGIFTAALVGATLSLFIEFAQLYLPQRDSNLRDAAANVTGTLAGSLGGLIVKRLWPNPTIHWPSPSACGLIFLWATWQMFPFLPLLRRYKLHELVEASRQWDLRELEFGSIVVAAVLLYAFIAPPGETPTVRATTTALALFLVLLGQPLVDGLSFSNARMIAAAGGLVAAILMGPPRRRSQWIAFATVLCGWIIVREVAPAQDRGPGVVPVRIPLQVFGFITEGAQIRSLSERAFLYCSAAAAWRNALLPWPRG